MQATSKALIAGVGIGLAGIVAAAEIRPGSKTVDDLVQSLAAGVILGSGVWPYGPSPIPARLQSKLLLDATDCEGNYEGGEPCGMYGLASATLIGGGDGDTSD